MLENFLHDCLTALRSLGLFFSLIFLVHIFQRRVRSLPPGPLGLPLLGNLFDMPLSEEGEKIANMAKKYGDTIYLKIFGSSVVFINSAKVAIELLDRRGAIYSDRPHHTMASEFCDMGDLIPISRFGERFKLERKLMNQSLSSRAVSKWEPIIIEEVRGMLKRLGANPGMYPTHLRRMGGSLVMNAMYGHRVVSDDDRFLQLANDFMAASSYAITGRWVVDFLPFIRYVPGLSFKRQAKIWRAQVPEWVHQPYESLTSKMSTEASRDSLCGILLFPKDGSVVDPVSESRVKWIATSAFGAGTDTMLVSMIHFICAMVLNPEVQAKAQKELDTVIGKDRLPTFEDRARLPYFECVYKETLRWGVPVPLTVPHRLMKNDVYEGFNIPKGSACIANIWGILHNEELYMEPERFYPERFLEKMDPEKAKLTDPQTYIFGFGRRRCPGIHLASSAVWYTMASLLATFNMTPAVDEKGNPIPIKAEFTSGAIRHLKPFECNISFRSKEISKMVA